MRVKGRGRVAHSDGLSGTIGHTCYWFGERQASGLSDVWITRIHPKRILKVARAK